MKNQGLKDVLELTPADISNASFAKYLSLDYVQNGRVDLNETKTPFEILRLKSEENADEKSKRTRVRYVSTGLSQFSFRPGAIFVATTVELFIDTETQTLCLMDNTAVILARQLKGYARCQFVIPLTHAGDSVCNFFAFVGYSVRKDHVLFRTGNLLLERFLPSQSIFSFHQNICQGCGLVGTKDIPLSRCSKCKAAVYCSRRCQLVSLPVHSPICNALAVHAEIRKVNKRISETMSVVPSGVFREDILATCKLPETKLKGNAAAIRRMRMAGSSSYDRFQYGSNLSQPQAFVQQQQQQQNRLSSYFSRSNVSDARGFEVSPEWEQMADQMGQIATDPSLADMKSLESASLDDQRYQQWLAKSNYGEHDLEHDVEDTGLNDKFDVRENQEFIRQFLLEEQQALERAQKLQNEVKASESPFEMDLTESNPLGQDEPFLSLNAKDEVE